MEYNECIMKTYGNVICAVVSSFLLSSGVNSNCRSKLNYTVHYRLVFQVCRQTENTNCLFVGALKSNDGDQIPVNLSHLKNLFLLFAFGTHA